MALLSIPLGTFTVGDIVLLLFEQTNSSATAVVAEIHKDGRIVLKPITGQAPPGKSFVVPSAPTGWTRLELGTFGSRYSTEV